MINQTEKYIETEVDNITFKKFIDSKRAEMAGELGYTSKKKYYPLDLIAKNLGVSSIDMLKKRINKQKPTKNRDFVIGLCAVLGCNSAETDLALKLYDFRDLDIEDTRDDTIIDYLEKNEGDISSIENINEFLASCNLSELDINSRKSANKNNTIKPYKVIKQRTRIYYDEGDIFDSLETAYDFRNKCATVFLIEKNKNNSVLLQVWSDGKIMVDKLTDAELPQIYNNPDEAGEYKVYFPEMLRLATNEQRKIDKYLNDTKNFPFRVGANLRNDSIHIFYEQFNYAQPERNEYYMMEYFDRHFRLSVSNKSMFMKEYLSKKDYNIHFKDHSKEKCITYDSSSDIQAQLQKLSSNDYKATVLKARIYAFKTLENKVEEILEQLRSRSIFVRNHDMIWNHNSAEVCRYFKVEENFDCVYDENAGILFAQKTQIEWISEDGQRISLSLDELKRAFELGYSDISQICRIKQKFGNIESVLL